MALLAMASARSPGLTTAAVALASSWPGKALLAELDPDGGTIAAGRAANPDPGLKTLAASGRHYLSPGLVTSNVQELPDGLAVLMAPASPDRCAAALEALNPVGLGETLHAIPGCDVIADCGRIDSNSPSFPVLRQADAVIFVLRPTLVDIVGLRSRLETLELPASMRAGIVVVDSGPHHVDDVTAAFSVPVLGVVDWDPRSASALAEGRRVVGRSKLIRSAERVAATIATQLEGFDACKVGASVERVELDGHHAGGKESSPIPVARRGVPSPAWTPPGPPTSSATAAASRPAL